MAAAARELNVDYTTVFRRLNAIEAELGVQLFERTRTACTPTVAGERILRSAAEVQESVDSALLEVSGQDARLTGTLRLTTTPSLAQCVVIPRLRGFREQYPGIEVELYESYSVYDLMHREADVALRFTRKPPESLVGVRIGTMASAAFASRAYAEAHRDLPIHEWDWITPTAGSVSALEEKWLRENVAPARVRMRCNTGPAAQQAAAAGLGVTLLVSYLGRCTGLSQVGPRLPELDEEVWLLTHPKLRQVARVRALFGYLQTELRENLAEIGGIEEAVTAPA